MPFALPQNEDAEIRRERRNAVEARRTLYPLSTDGSIPIGVKALPEFEQLGADKELRMLLRDSEDSEGENDTNSGDDDNDDNDFEVNRDDDERNNDDDPINNKESQGHGDSAIKNSNSKATHQAIWTVKAKIAAIKII